MWPGHWQTIAQPNQGPRHKERVSLVTFALPLPGSTIIAGASLAITGDANVRDGSSDSIEKVDFYADGHNIGTAASFPYSITWPNMPPGTTHCGPWRRRRRA